MTSLLNNNPPPRSSSNLHKAASSTNQKAAHANNSSNKKNDLLDGVGKVRFLLEMSNRLEQDGNIPESIQSAESALLLRRELSEEDQSLFTQSLQRQAQELVMRCNALGVSSFQKDQFDAATFLLEKALLLTDENPTMHTFTNHEHDRLRLRAATFNNVGCMEKRRGTYDVALKNLQQAVELETLVDPDVGAGPSTYLNMCTILNKMGDFVQAINAADRALRAAVLQQQQGREISPQFVHLIVMAHYNRGVALEFAGRPGDIAKAHDSYMQAVRTADRFGPSNVSAGSESVKEAAISAIKRLDQQPALAFGLSSSDQQHQQQSSASPLSASLGNLSGGGGNQSGSGKQQPMDLATARLLAQLAPLPPPGAVPVVTAAHQQQEQSNNNNDQSQNNNNNNQQQRQAPGSAPLPSASGISGGGLLGSGINNRTTRQGGSGFVGSGATAAANRRNQRMRAMNATTAANNRGSSNRGGRGAMDRKEAYDARIEAAARKAKSAHQKERSERQRKEQEAAVAKREEEAKALYRRTEATLRNERINKLHSSAIKIQKAWRGYYARDIIAAMAEGALRIQAVYRSHRCRVQLARAQVAKQEAHQQEEIFNQKVQACNLMMRPVRRFLRICDTWRKLHSLRLQRFHSARKIQRAWREYRVRCEEEFLNRIASEKKVHEEKIRRHNQAAKKIQTLFKSWKQKRLMRIVRMEQQRRATAATKIQALIRGTLTRVWYRHFIVYRRQQMLSTAASLRKIVKIQSVWRGSLARRLYRRLSTEKRIRDRENNRFVSARRLQCFWRVCVARTRFEALKYQANRRYKAATKIQMLWRGETARRYCRQLRQQNKELHAARVIQAWYRDMRLRRKQIREARWAAERRADEKKLLRRTGNAMCIQTWSRFALSRLAFSKSLEVFLHRQENAEVIQRIGRGHLGRKDVSTTKKIAWLVDQKEKKFVEHTKAAKCIQRNVRSYLSKTKLETLKREFASSCTIQAYCRGYRSYNYVLSSMRHNRMALCEVSARKIQKSVRLWISRKHLLELEKYYLMIRRNKLVQMRRDEAATQVQSLWRGHAARKLAKREKQRELQRTIDCVTIQRWFRRRRFRLSITEEFARRRYVRGIRTKAAVKVQSFWRRILAEEYIAVLRERVYYKTVAAIVLQCFWRKIRALRITRDKREARKKFDQMCLDRQEALEYGAKLITAFLRSRYDGWKSIADRERTLAEQLERKVMATYLLRNAAATKIQAVYRGGYERVYVRGLRRERQIKQKIEEDIALKEFTAARRIQCCARCWMARRAFQSLLHEKREKELNARLDYEERADPENLVQQLFWVQEALTHRNIGQERKKRLAASHEAAVKIQAIARGYIMRRRRARLQYEKRAETVSIIGDSHDLTEQEAMALKAVQEEAATMVQKVIRGFLARKRWREQKQHLLEEEGENTEEVEMRDRAATRIQAVRRGYIARVFTTELRDRISYEKEERQRHEAARMIQRNWRQHNERVKKRRPKLVSGVTPNMPYIRPDNVGTMHSRLQGASNNNSGALPNAVRSPIATPSDNTSLLTGNGVPESSLGFRTPSSAEGQNNNNSNNVIPPVPPPRGPMIPRPPSGGNTSNTQNPRRGSLMREL